MKVSAKKSINGAFKSFCLLLSGIGVGWLVGLSVSPVIHIVITSVVAFVVSITSAVAGLKVNQDKDQPNTGGSSKKKFQVEVNPVPIMLMVVGIACGASLGVYGRTNGWLGTRPARFAEQWKDTGLDSKEISRRLFDTLYPPKSQTLGSNDSINSPSVAAGNGGQSNTSGSGAAQENGDGRLLSSSADGTVPKNPTCANTGRPSGLIQKSEVQAPVSSGISPQHFSGVLFSAPAPRDCDTFQTARPERLNELMTNNRSVENAAKSCKGEMGCLKSLVARACDKPRR
jgi:hypothetical protein